MFPELSHLTTIREKWRALNRAVTGIPGMIGFVIIFLVLASLSLYVLYAYVMIPLRLPWWANTLGSAVTIASATLLGLALVLRRAIRAELRFHLRSTGTYLCFQCGERIDEHDKQCYQCNRPTIAPVGEIHPWLTSVGLWGGLILATVAVVAGTSRIVSTGHVQTSHR